MSIEPNRAEFAISAGTEPIIQSNPPSFVTHNISSEIFNQLNRDYLAHQAVLAVGANPNQQQQQQQQQVALIAATNQAVSTGTPNSQQSSLNPRTAAAAAVATAASASVAVQRIASDLLELQKANKLQGNYLQSNPTIQNSGSTVNYVNPGFQSSTNSTNMAAVSGLTQMGYDMNQPFVSFLSEIESAILRSQHPIELNEVEEITVNGERGIWANRNEVAAWRGQIPIVDYPINEDPQPQLVTKRTQQKLDYTQEIAIRYLNIPIKKSKIEN